MAKTTVLKKNSLQSRDIVKTSQTVIVSAIVYVIIWAIEKYIVKASLVEEIKAAISLIVGMLYTRFIDGNKVVVEVDNITTANEVAKAVKREV